jgi:xanthine dehydrogenase accessory factor
MKKQLLVWNLIAESLDKQIPVTLLYVLESKGSSPGRQGFFMAVNAEGDMEGSIGGGIMEHRFVEIAKRTLSQKSILQKQIHAKTAHKNSSGMICSGEQSILLYQIKKEEMPIIKKII